MRAEDHSRGDAALGLVAPATEPVVVRFLLCHRSSVGERIGPTHPLACLCPDPLGTVPRAELCHFTRKWSRSDSNRRPARAHEGLTRGRLPVGPAWGSRHDWAGCRAAGEVPHRESYYRGRDASGSRLQLRDQELNLEDQRV